jgi:ATP-dependent DNA ligase
VTFDALAAGGRDLRREPQLERRRELESLLRHVMPPIFVTRPRATGTWRASGSTSSRARVSTA